MKPLLRALLIAVLLPWAACAQVVVTSNADTGAGTLRQAILTATNGETITFAPGLSGASILLASTLTITTNLTIDASALPGSIKINGQRTNQVFVIVATNLAIVMNALTITNGFALNNPYGGGVSNASTLTLNQCTFSGNYAGTSGGAVYSSGTVTLYQCNLTGNYSHFGVAGLDSDAGVAMVNQCTFSTNSTDEGGGGLENGSGTMTVTNCTLTDNLAIGIANGNGSMTVSHCTLTGNLALGIYNSSGTMTVNQCTLSGNISTRGAGAIYNDTGMMTVNQCTLSGNQAQGDFDDGSAGGIYNSSGTVTVTNCTLSGNISGAVNYQENDDAGGIYNDYEGTMTVDQCTISENTGQYGGGIGNAGMLTVNQCTLTGNVAAVYGGGIWNDGGTLTVNQSGLSGNSTLSEGGGMANAGDMTVNECTLFGNTGSDGGGLWNEGGLTVNQCTISGNNTTNTAGGIFNQNILAITNSIIAGNTSPTGADLYNYSYSYANPVTLGGSNLIQQISGTYSGPVPINPAPQLAPPGNYGGPTQTLPPLHGSPVIDAGSDAATNTFATDQRGYPRLSGLHVDLGAVEAQFVPDQNPPVLKNVVWSKSAKTFQFAFTNAPQTSFSVLTATNLALPLSKWTLLGLVPEISSGQFQFTDLLATNKNGFYRVVSP